MNWLDLLLLFMLGIAALRGFQRGFIIEICSFIALWLGVYAGLHFSGTVAEWLDLEKDSRITSFVITFLGVLFLVHMIARGLTTLIDLALLGFANKLAGVGVAVLRSAFMLSITLNILLAYTDNSIPPPEVRAGSVLHGPIRSFSPTLLPVLSETKWVKDMIEQLKQEALEWGRGMEDVQVQGTR